MKHEFTDPWLKSLARQIAYMDRIRRPADPDRAYILLSTHKERIEKLKEQNSILIKGLKTAVDELCLIQNECDRLANEFNSNTAILRRLQRTTYQQMLAFEKMTALASFTTGGSVDDKSG